MESSQKVLYNFFVKSGQDKRATEILSVYPQFLEKVNKPKEKK
tara:strand:- start:3245 stop:3373 length:129 start_codon:yes stop_codon:yes gene_type:complete